MTCLRWFAPMLLGSVLLALGLDSSALARQTRAQQVHCTTDWLRRVYRDHEPTAPPSGRELHHVAPGGPGITRKGKTYIDSSGHIIRDPKTLRRIENLKIPPKYKKVWISEDTRAVIQAVAEDSKGRKQYRYHADWTAEHAILKFSKLADIGEALVPLREKVDRDLNSRELGKDRALAAIARLLDTVYIRIGNEEYAKEDRTYGLTTMLKRHLKEGSPPTLRFIGKEGVHHKIPIEDADVLKYFRDSSALQGGRLFQWRDENGAVHGLSSAEVNDYLAEASGIPMTAKNFRTWGGTTAAAARLMELPVPEDGPQFQKNVAEAFKFAATRLGNTPAVARKSYVDPALIHLYSDAVAFKNAVARARANARKSHRPVEEELVLIVRQWANEGRLK